MTNVSTQQKSLLLTPSRARNQRFPLALLKRLVLSRRTDRIDFRSANEHFLKDIGLGRSNGVPHLRSDSRFW